MNLFPRRRMRRLRKSPGMRSLIRETRLSSHDFIYPLFVVENAQLAGPVESMPGVVRHTLETLDSELEDVIDAGIASVLLFGLPAQKDAKGLAATRNDSVVAEAVRSCKDASRELVVMTDVCLCSYTDHGHCGIVDGHTICNDETLDVLGRMAVAHARAGADLVAPSAMMDGMVAGLRDALDHADLQETGILSYAVKYASSFYGPFREAADCAPGFGDRRTYQMDPSNAREAVAEAKLDIQEGTDIIMVKPALPYLDIVRRIKETFPEVPLAAYQVSGEYSMIKAAAACGWLDERQVVMESLTSIKRAGADMIVSYWAKQAARWLAS